VDSGETYNRESIRETRPSASALRPCFINKFVNNSNNGSISGGSECELYPRIASGLTMTGATCVDVDVEAGEGSLKSDEADGVFFNNADSASNSDEEEEEEAALDVDGVFENLEVVDKDLKEEDSPLNDVFSDMMVCID